MFWTTYPHFGKRSRKEMALLAWDRIKPKTPEMLARIMAGLESWKQSPDWSKDGGQFVDGAQKWLRQQSWDASDGESGNGRDPFADFVAAGKETPDAT